MDVRRPVTLVRVSLLRRSSSPTGSSTGKAAEASAAQPTAESVRVAGGTAAKGRPTPKRREAENRRRGPAPAPPKTQREAAKFAKANRPPKEEQREQRRRETERRRAGMARGEDKYLPPRDRGPVRAYIRDVVDSRPHLLGLFMPLALVVVASVLVPVPAVQQYMSLFSLAMLMVMIAEGVYLGLSTTREVRAKFPNEDVERTGHRLVRVHPGEPAAAAADAEAAGPARGEPVAATLVLGGTRSGKSGYAEGLLPADAPVRYLATARRRPGDAEWDARIAAHRARRPAGVDDGGGTGRAGAPARRRARRPAARRRPRHLADRACSTTRRPGSGPTCRRRRRQVAALVDAVGVVPGRVVLVSAEVGLGVVPSTRAGRVFRDELGALNAALAAVCDEVLLLVAGLPLRLK